MDLTWGDERAGKFVSSVGLITTKGDSGDNIMAAEWTHQLSYSPGIISVSIGNGKVSGENIKQTKEFGVNLVASDQSVMVNIAGKSHGKGVDKIKVLEELGFKFFKAKKINTLMVEGVAFQAECKVKDIIPLGDHTMFVGDIVELYPLSNKDPLVYHKRIFLKQGEKIEKPNEKELERINKIIEKHTKKVKI